MNLSLLIFLGVATLSAGIVGWSLTGFILFKFKFLKPQELVLELPVKLKQSQKLLMAGLVVGLGVGFLGDFSSGIVLTGFFLLGWLLFQKYPSWKRKYDIKKKQIKMAEVFPQSIGMAIQALKTGQTIPQVLEYLARECPPPLKEELSLVCAEMDLGASADQALSKMADRFPDFSEFYQFLESYKISRQTGANLTQLLQVLVEGMEEKNRILRKMDAMTAQARLSGLMIGLLPFLLAFVFFLMDPNLILPLFTQRLGWGILFVAAILETIGFLWIRQLLQLEI